MRRAVAFPFLASFGCVLVTGGTEGYHAGDAGSSSCVDAQIGAIEAPEVEIGDSGDTVPECVSCIQGACASEIVACQADCACRTTALAFFRCLGEGRTTTSCLGDALDGGATPPLLALGGCLQQSPCRASSCGGDGGS